MNTRIVVASLGLLIVQCTGSADEWSARDRRVIASLQLGQAGPVPTSPSNRYANHPNARAFGQQLFFDTRLSGDGKRSCASCHQPKLYFADGQTTSQGVKPGRRNTPTIVGAAYNRWFYWDGRRDSMWSQALIPFEAADEMGASRAFVVRLLLADNDMRRAYESVFGRLPGLGFRDRLPVQAGPFGAPETQKAWHRLPIGLRQQVNRIYANLGKAIEAYERTLVPVKSRFDRFAEALSRGGSDADALLTAKERRGLSLFISNRTRCLRCHNGPLFTNGGFHNIGTATGPQGQLDFGRIFGLNAVLMDEFNCAGPYSDAEASQCTALRFVPRGHQAHLEGAFKVPSLRGVSKTAPYFHDGRFQSLDEVVRFYNAAAVEADGVELAPLQLTDDEVNALVSFLRVL